MADSAAIMVSLVFTSNKVPASINICRIYKDDAPSVDGSTFVDFMKVHFNYL